MKRRLADAEARAKGERPFSKDDANRYSSILIECCYRSLKGFYSKVKMDRLALSLDDPEPYSAIVKATYEAGLNGASPLEAVVMMEVVKEPNVEALTPVVTGVNQYAIALSIEGFRSCFYYCYCCQCYRR